MHPDSVYKFAYTYDQHNRLTHAKIYQGIDSQPVSEAFSYDHNGNICTLSRYNGTSLIDDLLFTYQPTSNRLASVADYADPADLTSVKEYHDNHTATLSESDMTYDANGNMVSDADRGISVIKYNLLNLPDTIQFTNGNQIINLYDAAGTKYQTIYYTLFPTIATPYYNIAHYGLNSDTVAWNITEYAGNVENYYSRTDTLRRIFNAEGYIERDTLYCYYRDHLGNNVAVRNMVLDSIVQRTVYYASGLPMAQSTSAGKQPYKYNGKEFVEMHGWNTYDHGFRGYYAPIGRFTSVDPLAEQTPWLSPYSYAGDRFANTIDWMGLATWDPNNRYHTVAESLYDSNHKLRYTELDNDGIVTKHIDNDDDKRVMLNGAEIGTEIASENYKVGRRAYFRMKGGLIRKIYNYELGIWVSPNTTWDQKVAKWLRAKNVDKYEEILLEYEQPLIQEIILLFNSELGVYNAIMVLSKGETIYSQKADDVDKALAICSLLTLGASKLTPIEEAAKRYDYLNKAFNTTSFTKSITSDYESICQKNH